MQKIILFCFLPLFSCSQNFKDTIPPVFMGGEYVLEKHLKEELKKYSLNKCVLKKVEIIFRVTPKGEIDSLRILKGIDYGAYNQATTAAVKSTSGRWQAATYRDTAVPIFQIIPFRLYVAVDAEKCEKAEQFHIKGIEYFKSGDFKNAIKYLSDAIENDSEDADAYFFRGSAKFEIGNEIGACNDWKAAVEYGNRDAKNIMRKNCKKEE